MKLDVLFIGLGSIGSRHLKNLSEICRERGIELNVTALRSDLNRALREGVEELLSVQLPDLGEEITGHYDIAFVTNPTSLHADTVMRLKGKADALFVEKPIFSNDCINLEIDKVFGSCVRAYVAAPMRYSTVMLAAKEYLDSHPDKRPFCARAISSSYLPDWRQGVDYRKVYSARRELGGGVTIDLIHEWDYLCFLFGKPEKVYNFKGTYSELEINSDDLSVYIAKYPTMLAELHLDYFGRKNTRYLEVYFEDGTLRVDFINMNVEYPDGTVKHFEDTTAEWYIREMNTFLDFILSDAEESSNTPREALDTLKITLAEEDR